MGLDVNANGDYVDDRNGVSECPRTRWVDGSNIVAGPA